MVDVTGAFRKTLDEPAKTRMQLALELWRAAVVERCIVDSHFVVALSHVDNLREMCAFLPPAVICADDSVEDAPAAAELAAEGGEGEELKADDAVNARAEIVCAWVEDQFAAAFREAREKIVHPLEVEGEEKTLKPEPAPGSVWTEPKFCRVDVGASVTGLADVLSAVV